MSGPNFNGKYSVCRYEIEDDGQTFNYFTLVWGYDTEDEAAAALPGIAAKEGIDVIDLAVVSAVFPAAY